MLINPKRRTPMALKRLIIIISVMVLGSLLIFNSTATSSYALPKPYQDKINEAHKKKQEEKEKKKKEEEEKKKEEEKDDEDNSNDKDNAEPDVRYLIPIIPDRDMAPRIKIVELSLMGSSIGDSNRFRSGDSVDVKLKYRVTDYQGYDNVNIMMIAYDDSGFEINQDNITNPIRIGDTVTEIFNNVIPQNILETNSNFRIGVTIEVEGIRESGTVYAQVGNYTGGGQIRIHRVFLTSDNYLDFGYWNFPKESFSGGDPYRLVVEYELDRGSDNDVEFEYKLTTRYDSVIDEGNFWDNARQGFQEVVRHGWFPNSFFDEYSGVRVEVKAYYAGDMDTESCYVQVHADDNDWYDQMVYEYPYRQQKREFSIGPVYFANDIEPSKYKSYFTPDESINVIVSYDYNRLPYGSTRHAAVLKYVVYSPSGEECISGRTQFFPLARDKKRIKLLDPGQTMLGRYEIDITLEIGDYAGTNKSYFYINRDTSDTLLEKSENEPRLIPGTNPIEYQIDNYLLLKLPPDWDAAFGYEPDDPPLIFQPAIDITGEVLIFSFDNPSISIDDAIAEYEKKEKENSGIGEYKESFVKTIDGQNSIYRFYDGKIISKGKFFEEKTENVKIGTIFSINSEKDFARLYVIRIVAPWDKFDELYNITSSLSEMIKYSVISSEKI